MEDFRSLNEECLLVFIGCGRESSSKDDQEEAERAFLELLDRHEAMLRRIVRYVLLDYQTWGFEPDEIYNRIVEKIWKKAEKFRPKNTENDEEIKKQFYGWARSMTKNEIADDLRGFKLDMDPRELEEISESSFVKLGDSHSARVRAVEAALEKLPQGDQEVLRALALSTPMDGGQLRTPSDEIKLLAARLGVTQASLRQKRKRALAKLKKALEADPVFQ